MSKIKNLKNQKFGRLIATKYVGSDKYGNAKWLCRCECGNKKIIVGNSLKTGNVKSCGCLNTKFKKGNIPWNKGSKGLQRSIFKNKKVPWLVKYQFKEKELHPNWRGGISRDKHSITSPKYKKWRKEVFERDNYICQICFGEDERMFGEKEFSLEAHHIKRWADHKELRYVVNNGITLCRECHFCLHHIKEVT